MFRLLLSLSLMTAGFSNADTVAKRKIAQAEFCEDLKAVELSLRWPNNENKLTVPNASWILDSHVYLGWGADLKEAEANAMNACTAAANQLLTCQGEQTATMPKPDRILTPISRSSTYYAKMVALSGCKSK